MKNIILTILATTIATTGITTSMERPFPDAHEMEMPLPDAHAMERPSSKRKRDMPQTSLTIETLQNLSVDRATKDLRIVADSLPSYDELKERVDDIYRNFLQSETFNQDWISDINKDFPKLKTLYQDWVRDINKYFPKLKTLFVEGLLNRQQELLQTAIADQNLNIRVIQKAPSVKKARKAHKNATSLPLPIQNLHL